MTPVEPRDGDGEGIRVTFAKDQPQYRPLPAVIVTSPNGEEEVTTEWELSDEDRVVLFEGGRIQLKLWTFRKPLQPIHLSAIPAPCPTEIPRG